MELNSYSITITNNCDYFGLTCLTVSERSGAGTFKTFFNTNNLEPQAKINDNERRLDRCELIKDAAACQSGYIFEQLVREYGAEYFIQMIKEMEREAMLMAFYTAAICDNCKSAIYITDIVAKQ